MGVNLAVSATKIDDLGVGGRVAEGKKEFEGIPSGAAFEAAQRALRELSLDVLDEDHARRQIHAERKKTFWKEYAEIDLQVSEIGQTTEVRVKKSPKSMLDMEGKELVNAILSRVESELDKIKSDGRISRYSFGQVASGPPSEVSPPMRRTKASQSEKAAEKKSGGGLSILQFIGIILVIHFFFGWEWLGNLTAGQNTETRAANLVAALDGYSQASPRSIDPVDLGRRVPNMTDVQLASLEDNLKGTLVTARGPLYDVQSASPSLGLTRFEVVVWAMTISPVRLPVRGTCIARNAQEAAMIERLTVGQNVRITGEVRSVGRTLGVRLRNCIVEPA